MSIRSPSCQWPVELDERGPAEDPSIVLTGKAYVGRTPLQVVAVRMNPASGRLPDYKPDVPAAAYADAHVDIALFSLLDELEYVANELDELLGDDQPGTVALAGGVYRFCALPAAIKT